MGRVALRDVRAHLVQFGLSVLAVLLGVAFVAGTFALRTMLGATFSDIIATSVQGDAYLRGAEQSASGGALGGGLDGDRTRIPIDLAATVDEVDGVEQALPELSGPIVLVGPDGTAVQNGQAPSFGLGLDPDNPTYAVVDGRRPTAAGEIALTGGTLVRSGLALGDATTIVVGGAVTPVDVVGEVDLGAPNAGPVFVFLDVAAAQTAYAPDGLVSSIAVYAADGIGEQEMVDRLDTALADAAAAGEISTDGVEVVTGEAARDEATASVTEVLGFIGTFLLVFAGISLFVGGFIIANTFAMSVRQRQREFALLRAVGASPGQVFASVVVQAAVVGLVGSGLGVVAGVALVSVLRVVLARMGMDLSGDIPLEVSTVTLSMGIGTLVSVVAAVIPARRAALVPPVEAMREDVTTQEHSLHLRAAVGAALLAGGLVAVFLATSDRVEQAGAWLGLGAAAVLVAVLVLAPTIARTTLAVLAAPAVAAIRPLGRLARGNVTRNPRRTASTASALIIGMALVGATTVLASTAQASTRTVVETESTADLVVQSASFRVPAEAVPAVSGLDVVARADTVSVATAQVTGPGEGDAGTRVPTTLAGVSGGAVGTTLAVPVLDGSLDGLGDGDVAVQKTTAEAQGWSVGDDLVLTTDTGDADVTIRAVIDSRILGAPLILSEEYLSALLPETQRDVTTIFVAAAPGVGVEELRRDVTAAVAPFVVLSVQTNDELATSLADQVDQVLVILYALLGLSIVIAVLGIVNTLALAVIERTREIGLLRAVGLGRFQLAGTIAIESVLTAVFGTAVGVAVGVALASAMPYVFADVGLGTLAIPWAQVGAMLALAVVVGVLASLWPGVRAARLPVLEAIAQE